MLMYLLWHTDWPSSLDIYPNRHFSKFFCFCIFFLNFSIFFLDFKIIFFFFSILYFFIDLKYLTRHFAYFKNWFKVPLLNNEFYLYSWYCVRNEVIKSKCKLFFFSNKNHFKGKSVTYIVHVSSVKI